MKKQLPDMLEIVIYREKGSNYTSHGTRNKQGGYSGTSDNKMAYSTAVFMEWRNIPAGEPYRVIINGKIHGEGIKGQKEAIAV